MAGRPSARVVLETLPAAAVPLEKKRWEQRGLEHHNSSHVLFFVIILETAFSFRDVFHG